MRATPSLVRREFAAYFLSPIAYVVLAVFLAVTGHLFYLTLAQLTARGPQGVNFPMQLMLTDTWFWLVFLFIPPLLTMRLIAEEQSSGTLEMLLTAPLRDWQIVLSKFLACFGFYIVLWLPTLLYLPILLDLDWSTRQIGVDPWPVASSYLGLAMAVKRSMYSALHLLVRLTGLTGALAVACGLFWKFVIGEEVGLVIALAGAAAVALALVFELRTALRFFFSGRGAMGANVFLQV